MLKNKVTAILLALLVLSLALTACGIDKANEAIDAGEEKEQEEQHEEQEKIEKLTMGFYHSYDIVIRDERLEPLTKRLSEELSVKVELERLDSLDDLTGGMQAEQIDFAQINPFAFVAAERAADVELEPILKAERFGAVYGQYNVLADSDIETIDDLMESEGLVWAYPDRLTTSGFLFPATQLMNMDAGNLDDHFIHEITGSSEHALLALLNGEADFATTHGSQVYDARDLLVDDFPDAHEEIRVIGYTDPIPHDVIAVRSDLSDEWKDKLTDVFLSFNEDEEMLGELEWLFNWYGVVGVVVAESKDYDIIRDVMTQFEDDLSW